MRPGAAALLLALGACAEPADEDCLATPGIVCTIAGTGERGSGDVADEGDPLDIALDLPIDVSFAPDGTPYVIDWNVGIIRTIDPETGVMTRFAGSGTLGTLDDPPGSPCVDCDAVDLPLNHPTNIVFDRDGQMVVAAWHNSKIYWIDPAAARVTASAGTGRRAYTGDGGEAESASFDLPAALVPEADGGLLVMDQQNQSIRRIAADGIVDRFAGRCVIDPSWEPYDAGCAEGEIPTACPESDKTTCGDPIETCGLPCQPGYAGDGGLATDLRMGQPFGASAEPAGRMVRDQAGTLYFTDTSNNLVRAITADGIVRRVAGAAPTGDFPAGGYSGDGGPALDAQLDHPIDLAFGPDGTLFVSDVYNHCIRAIAPDGTIDAVAGICGQDDGYEGDGGPALEARFKLPFGIEVSGGVLYVADTGNNVIRAVRLE